MALESVCPSADQLENVMRGKLALAEVERISQHVETCSKCEQTLQSLQGEDTLAEHVRAEAGQIDKPIDQAVQKLIERMRNREHFRTDETVALEPFSSGAGANDTQALLTSGATASADLARDDLPGQTQGRRQTGRLRCQRRSQLRRPASLRRKRLRFFHPQAWR